MDSLAVPRTVAANVVVAPARTFADFGETPTVIVGGGTPGLPVEFLVTPEQAAWKKAARSNNSMEMRRTAVVPRLWERLGPSSANSGARSGTLNYDAARAGEQLYGGTSSGQGENRSVHVKDYLAAARMSVRRMEQQL